MFVLRFGIYGMVLRRRTRPAEAAAPRCPILPQAPNAVAFTRWLGFAGPTVGAMVPDNIPQGARHQQERHPKRGNHERHQENQTAKLSSGAWNKRPDQDQ